MSAMPSYNEIMDLIKKGMTLEAQERIISLRELALEHQKKNLELMEENKNLKEALKINNKIKWDKRGWYYFEGEQATPYCQVCYDKDSKLIHLQNLRDDLWRCLSCTCTFKKD